MVEWLADMKDQERVVMMAILLAAMMAVELGRCSVVEMVASKVIR